MQYTSLPTLGPGTVYIYGLTDPATGEIRYIGKSIRPCERVNNHMNEKSNCHRSHWLQSLKAKGLWPGLVIFEMMVGGWPWQAAERFWIAKGRALGWPLTNNTSGGDGVPDLPPEARERMRKAWLGRKHTPEALKKMSIGRTGIPATEERKEKMRRIMKGRKITWSAKIGEKLRKVSPSEIETILARIASGEKVKDLAAEFGVHRTTMSKIKKGKYP